MHHAKDLVTLFNRLFKASFCTVLQGDGEEPIYLPAEGADVCHRIVFTRDYYASALHEISHWCVAGEARRQLVDYGYWYEPDGRSPEQQRAFEAVEVVPQALEWIFSAAAGVKFRVSADNLNGRGEDTGLFTEQVRAQVGRYLSQGLTGRAALFCQALIDFYSRHKAFQSFEKQMLDIKGCQP
jgi:hypothetical protein